MEISSPAISLKCPGCPATKRRPGHAKIGSPTGSVLLVLSVLLQKGVLPQKEQKDAPCMQGMFNVYIEQTRHHVLDQDSQNNQDTATKHQGFDRPAYQDSTRTDVKK